MQQFSQFSVIKKLKKCIIYNSHGTECCLFMELSGIAIIRIGLELPLSELELEWNRLYRNWNWSGIAFIGIGIGIELPLGLGTGFGIGVELPLSELELELHCKNGIDPSSSGGIPSIALTFSGSGFSPSARNDRDFFRIAILVLLRRMPTSRHRCNRLCSLVSWSATASSSELPTP